jgi:hypothetical protein
MGILQSILKLFERKTITNQSEQSFHNQKSIEKEIDWQSKEITNQSENQKSIAESLQLGIAAGYTGRFLKEIESSLHRIESLMVTKDWFKSEFEDISPRLLQTLQFIKEFLENHEKNEQERFNSIQNSLKRLESIAEKAPEPLKKNILTEIRTIETQLPKPSFQPAMLRVINAIKEAGEITYADLGSKLEGVSEDYLRGVVSQINKIKPCIQTFKKPGSRKKWLRYIENQQSNKNRSEKSEINQKIDFQSGIA